MHNECALRTRVDSQLQALWPLLPLVDRFAGHGRQSGRGSVALPPGLYASKVQSEQFAPPCPGAQAVGCQVRQRAGHASVWIPLCRTWVCNLLPRPHSAAVAAISAALSQHSSSARRPASCLARAARFL